MKLKKYKNIKVGDVVKRKSERFPTEGIITKIEKFEQWDECEGERLGYEHCMCQGCFTGDDKIFCRVAVNGNLEEINIIKYNQLEKIDKDIQINSSGQTMLF